MAVLDSGAAPAPLLLEPRAALDAALLEARGARGAPGSLLLWAAPLLLLAAPMTLAAPSPSLWPSLVLLLAARAMVLLVLAASVVAARSIWSRQLRRRK